MKVKDLIEELKKCNQEADVIISKDSEGNAFSLYTDLAEGYYKGTGRFLDVAYGANNEEEYREDFGIDIKTDKKCIVLFRQ